MGMFERIVEDSIFIDFGSEIIYGSDQMYDSHPQRFATVNFQLMGTSLLAGLADRIRKDAGFVPFNPIDEYTDETCDGDGWYEFYIGVSDRYEGAADTSIEAVVCNSSSADEGGSYSIDLSEEEQGYIYSRLDEQCIKYLGKGCAELLKEAREAMEEYESHGFYDYSFAPGEDDGSAESADGEGGKTTDVNDKTQRHSDTEQRGGLEESEGDAE